MSTVCLHNQENIPALLLGSTLFGVGGNGLLGSSGVIRMEDQRNGVRQGSCFPTEMCKLGAPAVLFAHGGQWSCSILPHTKLSLSSNKDPIGSGLKETPMY